MIRVIASFDDGSILDLKTADLMYHYDIPTTFYIPVNWKKYLATKNIEPLQDDHITLLADQFEIGSHGVNHELLTRVSSELQHYEVFKSKDYWTDKLQETITKFCYPRGYYTDEIKKKVESAGYKSGRTVKVGNLSTEYDPYEQPTTVHVGYDRDEYGTDWVTYAKNKVKEAIKLAHEGNQVEYHLWGHSAEIDKYDQWNRLEQFLKYLREQL